MLCRTYRAPPRERRPKPASVTDRSAQQLSCRDREQPKGLEIMFDPVVIGFPRSTFVDIARLIVTHKDVPYTFRDIEPEMAREWAVSHRGKY
jgi:hypothetical protein